MRIVIDMQGAQTASRFRGIGRYTMAFAQAVVRNRGDHEIILALSGLFPDTIVPIRAAFDGLLPQENIRVWHAPGPVLEGQPGNESRREVAELIREAFLASLQPDVIHISSLFEGFGDDAVTSVGRFDPHMAVSVTLYDLIPLIHRDTYLLNPAFKQRYLEKIEHLQRAKLLLAISESSGREAVEHLGFDPSAVTSIATDCDARFRPFELDDLQRAHLQDSYGIDRPFVMYTGEIEPRKNIDRLIEAYATLPADLRQGHQLAVVCSVQEPERERLQGLARTAGLGDRDLVVTGHVPEDDLLALYNACTVFVFPSWHEGFGLPALEAMRCGRAVIASNTSSLPEVVGREDALFDPLSTQSIAQMIQKVLTDRAFRIELERHGLERASRFSWDESARKAWRAWEDRLRARPRPVSAAVHRPRLACVTPLPPERSGIADYSAELIPELMHRYDVEVVVAQPEVADNWIRGHCPIRTVEEFRARAGTYDRVLYHFGNSQFHQHMFALLEEVPGVVVLHDFYLSGIQAHRDLTGCAPEAWPRALQVSHGYSAVKARYSTDDSAELVWRYPANLPVLQAATGVIVHSESSRALARQWYGEAAGEEWAVIPLMRAPVTGDHREPARRALGLEPDDLLVCAFGMLGPIKLNHRLLDAWLTSHLSKNHRAHLVFVGENHSGDYGQELIRRIAASGAAQRIRITGWADADSFRRYLAAADIGVQLRTLSRGETSGAVLDCMNHGLATIVNAHGSLADLDPSGAWMLPDEFADNDLVEALGTLSLDGDRRQALGAAARQIVLSRHAPRACADQYAEAIERFHQRSQLGMAGLIACLAAQPLPKQEWPRLAMSLARNIPPAPRRRQLLVDVSALVQQDLRTGIQRVVRAVLREWLENPPPGVQVEPVYATGDTPGYRYAQRWTSGFLGVPDRWAEDAPAEAWPGDVFIGLDFHSGGVSAQGEFLRNWHLRGVAVWFVVYDLLPVSLPQTFPEGAREWHQRWLETISRFDGLACISRAVADEMTGWLASHTPARQRPIAVNWFHLGAEVDPSESTRGLPANAQAVLSAMQVARGFLMVGTIEPRKGHAQALRAFELLWQQGSDARLVIVGKQGWMVDKFVHELRTHAELGKRLFWLEGISDGHLEQIYAASTCLIAASHGEGFGLPLIEAARHRLSIIARDIPVFREVAGTHAYYFKAESPEGLAQSVNDWLQLYKARQQPSSESMPWLTWEQSAAQLLRALHLPPQSESTLIESTGTPQK